MEHDMEAGVMKGFQHRVCENFNELKSSCHSGNYDIMYYTLIV